MLTLVVGLLLFLGAHSVRVFAEGWRTAMVAKVGESWKGGYALVSIVGFGLICGALALHGRRRWCCGMPPIAMRHVAALLTLVASFLAAAYVPRNHLKARSTIRWCWA